MKITKTQENEKLVLALEGRLDTLTAPDLEVEVNAIPFEVKKLVLDMSNLEYISSAGLRIVLAAQKKMSKVGGMTLVGVNDTINEVFEITGFADILTIE